MSNAELITVSGDRLWSRLMDMAMIGATAKGGCNRQALTDLDKEGRDLFVSWCKAAGCSITIDQVGNIFTRRAGVDDRLDPVITGSHLDTQPTGGKFDGVLGVLAGLEVIETLNDRNVETKHPIEVVVWTNEEGARFTPAMIGSGVWAGVLSLDEAYSITDKEGKTFGGELGRIGYAGAAPAKVKPVKAAFELHIEQGPILEHEQTQIGVLTGIQGLRWYDLIITGESAHAGPTPMEVRRDPVQAALPILKHCYQLASQFAPWGRATIGDLHVEPGSRNTVPERLVVNIDLRHPDALVLDAMDQSLRKFVDGAAAAHNVKITLNEHWHMPVTSFDEHCVDSVRKAVRALGLSSMEMVSGAGHDSLYLAKVIPTGMIFIPCENGISHNEAENIKPEDAEAGCNVLLHSMLDQAGER